ncbi:MAG: GNAT family N-acetyltransferase [Flavobacteriales bacterium]|nr:GNAT family N-acetyltransferase [Flavobacteriales bacterium]
METRIGNISDIKNVIKLQSKYLFSNLNDDERKNGFVTTPFTVEQIQAIIEQNGLFVAEDDKEIIGYAFAGNWNYFKQWQIFQLMISRFSKLDFKVKVNEENSFQYGPICIDKAYRRSGLFQRLFEEMRLEFRNRYNTSITFINAQNPVSLHAHTKKLEWQVVDYFEFNNQEYLGLAYDMSISAL